MRKTTIFYGPRDSGKTTDARKLMSNGVEIHHHSKNYTWMYHAVTPETKQLLFDDCKDTGMIKSILQSDSIEVNKQFKKSQLLPTPDLIFTVSAEVVSLADIESCLLGHWNVELVRTNPDVVNGAIEWLKDFMVQHRYFIGNDLNQAFKEAEFIKNYEVKTAFLAGCDMGEMHNNENRCYETDAVEYLKTKTNG